MNTLSYPKKMGGIGLIGIFVISILFIVIYQQLNKTVIDSRLQLKGIEYISSVNEAIKLAQQYRGLSAATWSSNGLLTEQYKLKEIETELYLNSVLASLPSDMILKTGNTDVSNLDILWLDIKNNHATGNLEDDFAEHTYLVTQLQLLSKLIAEHHLLLTDTELTSYYLIDNLVNNTPEIVEYMGQVRAIVTGILSNKTLSLKQRENLIRLNTLMEQSFRSFEFNISGVKRYAPELTETVDNAYRLLTENKSYELELIQDDIFTEKFYTSPDTFFSEITTKINKTYDLMNLGLTPVLKAHIENRIDNKQAVIAKVAGISGLLLFVILLLMIGLYKSVITNIQHISKTINDYSHGNLNSRIKLDTYDEMREISIAVNRMADTANKARNEITNERERFRILFEKSGNGIVIIENGVIVDCNENSLAMMGYNSKADLMRSSEELSPEYQPDGRLSSEKFQELMILCIRDGSNRFEWLYKKKDGTLFWVHVLLTRLDYLGTQQIHVIWRDIDSQVEMEKKLEHKSKQLIFQQNALDEHAIVSIANRKGDITYVNDKFETISQYNRDELLGQNHRILRTYDYHPDEFYTDMWSTIANGQVWHGEIKNKSKDGSIYWVSSTIVPQIGANGKPEQYIAIRTDITNVKELERIARQEKKNADDANQEKSNFLANMSHELRTPMHGILSFAGFGIKKSDTVSKEKIAQYFSNIQTSGERLLALLNDLLDLSKFEAGKMQIYLKESDLSAIFTSCHLEQEQRMHDLGITLDIQPPTVSTTGRFDPVRIGQVITNLLSNAIKFSPENSVLQITIDTNKDKELLFTLKDSGVGIPEEELNDVFNAFIQSSKTKTGAGGTGLGLAISKKIIEAHGGNIWAENNRDGGALLSFTLPQ